MRREARIRRGCVWGLSALAVLIALVPWQCIVWDGGFPDVECRLRFVNSHGKPVAGVTLTVLTQAGGVCHFYPVDEFVPDRPVVSDAEGRMVFHHSSHCLEFGGREYCNLVGLGFGERSPRYNCVFKHGERELFRTAYNFHRDDWSEFRKPPVTREYAPPWDVKKHGWQPDEGVNALRLRIADGKPRDKMDREERIAARSLEEYFMRDPSARQTTFLVVERTIVVPNP